MGVFITFIVCFTLCIFPVSLLWSSACRGSLFSRIFPDRKWWPRKRKWRPFSIDWVYLVIKTLYRKKGRSSNAFLAPGGIIGVFIHFSEECMQRFAFSRIFSDRKWWPRNRKWRPFGVDWVYLVIKTLYRKKEGVQMLFWLPGASWGSLLHL